MDSNIEEMLAEKNVEGLIGKLSDPDYDTRCAAAQALAELQAVEPLVATLKNVAPLTGLSDSNRLMCEFAKDALVKIGAPAIEPLIAALKDSHQYVRLAVIEVLGKIGDERTAEVLIAALSDEEASVRFAAVMALDSGDFPVVAQAVEPLIAFMTNESEKAFCRGFAARALGKIRDQRAVEPLLAALKSDDLDLCKAAVYALGKFGDTRFIEPLVAAVVNKPYERLFYAVGDSLTELGIPAVAPLVTILRSHESRVARQLAAVSLEGIGDAQAVEPFIAALKDTSKYVRAQVAGGLGKVGAQLHDEVVRRQIVEALIPTLLHDEDADCRHVAAWSLEKLADPQAIDPLIAALQDTDEWTRRNAAKALVTITGEDFGQDAVRWTLARQGIGQETTSGRDCSSGISATELGKPDPEICGFRRKERLFLCIWLAFGYSGWFSFTGGRLFHFAIACRSA